MPRGVATAVVDRGVLTTQLLRPRHGPGSHPQQGHPEILSEPCIPHQTTEGNFKRESQHTRITGTFIEHSSVPAPSHPYRSHLQVSQHPGGRNQHYLFYRQDTNAQRQYLAHGPGGDRRCCTWSLLSSRTGRCLICVATSWEPTPSPAWHLLVLQTEILQS